VLLLLSLAGCVLYVLLVWDWATGGAVLRGSRREVVVLYVFAYTDPEVGKRRLVARRSFLFKILQPLHVAASERIRR
jgi:hypothetical protein